MDSLRAILDESAIDLPEGMPPMAAGLVGYMSYDMVRLMEKLPDENPKFIEVPDGLFMRPTVIAVFDTIEDLVTVITPVRPEAGVDAATAYRQAQERLADIVADFERSLPYRRETRPSPRNCRRRSQT